MVAVANVVDRVIRDFLEPPDEMWVRAQLASDLTSASPTLSIDLSALALEEQDLLGAGLLIEIDREQMAVVSLQGSTLTVMRGQRGTQAVAHASGATILVKPPYTRSAVFDAVAESIVALHPPLFTNRFATVEVGENGEVRLPDDVITVKWVGSENSDDLPWRDLGTDATGRRVRIFRVEQGKDVEVGYRSRFAYPNSEDVSLAQLGVRDEWARIVVVSAAAQLISSKPMSTGWQDYVASQMRTEAYPVDTPARIRDSMVRYREYLIEQAATGLLHEDQPTVQYSQ